MGVLDHVVLFGLRPDTYLLLISARCTTSSHGTVLSGMFFPVRLTPITLLEPDTVSVDTYFLKSYCPTWMFWLEAQGACWPAGFQPQTQRRISQETTQHSGFFKNVQNELIRLVNFEHLSRSMVLVWRCGSHATVHQLMLLIFAESNELMSCMNVRSIKK